MTTGVCTYPDRAPSLPPLLAQVHLAIRKRKEMEQMTLKVSTLQSRSLADFSKSLFICFNTAVYFVNNIRAVHTGHIAAFVCAIY